MLSLARVMTTQTHVELSSGDHGVDLCSVLYTIMPMSLTRVRSCCSPIFGVVHHYADELSSGGHGVHLCSVLYTIMPMSLARVIMVFTYVRCCVQLCRRTSSFVSPLFSFVRPNAPALWMSSLHQGSWFPRARSHMYIYLL